MERAGRSKLWIWKRVEGEMQAGLLVHMVGARAKRGSLGSEGGCRIVGRL